MPQSFVHLVVHLVFSTKDRLPLIKPEIRIPLFAHMGGIVREMGGKVLMANGTSDHVHVLISLPATTSLADAVWVIKTNSSRWVHEKWPEQSAFGWQAGYGAFSVSQSAVDDVVRYIEGQEEHHKKYSFQDEFLALLKKHGISYDAAHIWQ